VASVQLRTIGDHQTSLALSGGGALPAKSAFPSSTYNPENCYAQVPNCAAALVAAANILGAHPGLAGTQGYNNKNSKSQLKSQSRRAS